MLMFTSSSLVSKGLFLIQISTDDGNACYSSVDLDDTSLMLYLNLVLSVIHSFAFLDEKKLTIFLIIVLD